MGTAQKVAGRIRNEEVPAIIKEMKASDTHRAKVDHMRKIWLDYASTLERQGFTNILPPEVAFTKDNMRNDSPETEEPGVQIQSEQERENKVRYNDELAKNLLQKLKTY